MCDERQWVAVSINAYGFQRIKSLESAHLHLEIDNRTRLSRWGFPPPRPPSHAVVSGLFHLIGFEIRNFV